MFVGNHAYGLVEVAVWRGEPERGWELARAALDLVAEHEYLFYTARLYVAAIRAAAEIAQRARTLGDDAAAEAAVRDARAAHERFSHLLEPDRWSNLDELLKREHDQGECLLACASVRH